MPRLIHPAPRHPSSPGAALVLVLPVVVALALITMLLSRPHPADAGGPAAPVAVIDSTFPIEEEIRRFRATVSGVPATLREGAPSIEALVSRFAAAVESADTAALARLVLQRDEFIGVYYPHTRYTTAPYELSPALLWFQMQNRSSRGLGRLLAREGGRPLGVTGYRCGQEPRHEATNRIWEGCTVEVRPAGGAPRMRTLFGSILEQGGRFKFLTYANDY